MKRTYVILLFASIFFLGCNKDNCHPEMKEGVFSEDTEIKKHYNETYQRNEYSVGEGNKLVFEYLNTKAQCDNAYDDELLKTLTFELGPDVSQFRLEGNGIASANCFFRQYGAWAGGNTYEVTSGVMEGAKVSATKWRIKASVLTTPLFQGEKPEKIEFDQVFEKR